MKNNRQWQPWFVALALCYTAALCASYCEQRARDNI